jgi:predicted secreted hydrolase
MDQLRSKIINSKAIHKECSDPMNAKVFIGIFCILVLFCPAAFADEYLDVTPDYTVKFPDDFFYKKDYRVQWWYFTGHLFDEKGREFGYELTFFIVNVQKRDYHSRFGVNKIFISHFAVSDIAGNKFIFSDKTDSGAYGFSGSEDSRLKVWIEDDTLEGTLRRMFIKASDQEKTIELQLYPSKPVVLNGENGYSRKSEESPLLSSIYFSLSHLKTEGTLRIGEKVFHVKGTSWFDREISTRGPGEDQKGWDWFALQLHDNREIMLYIVRHKDGSIDTYSSGTFIYPDGRYRRLLIDDFSVKALHHYTSEKTGARYPSQWEISIPSEHIVLTVTPLMKDQEVLANSSTGNYYWEGTCKVEGSAQGRAYVEMTGY